MGNREKRLALTNFYNKKTIQNSFDFLVDIWPSKKQLDFMPNVESFHVKNVTIPNFNAMQKEKRVQLGAKTISYPTIKSEGINFRMEVEETSDGIVQKFILWCYNNYIDENGLHNYPDNAKLDSIEVQVMDSFGNNVVRYSFKRPFLVNADPISYSYDSNDSIKYTLSFTCDNYEVDFADGSVQFKNFKE